MRKLRCRQQGPSLGHMCGKQWSWAGLSGPKLVVGVWGKDKTDLGTLGTVKHFRYPGWICRWPEM